MKGWKVLNIEIVENTRDSKERRYSGVRIWGQGQQKSTLNTETIKSQHVTIEITHLRRKQILKNEINS